MFVYCYSYRAKNFKEDGILNLDRTQEKLELFVQFA